ncbi:MAG: FAD-dependent monooxygenase, partial [Bacteroidota bacterium]
MAWIVPKTYQNPIYPYKRSFDQDSSQPKHHQVVIIGAGPVGLCAALDLASREIPCVILSDRSSVTVGSRAICFAKKTLEIVNRICQKAYDRMIENKHLVTRICRNLSNITRLYY